MPARSRDDELEAALEALTQPDRFRAAESRVAAIAPQLQRILAQALEEGGWLAVHDAELRKAAGHEGSEERVSAVRQLVAEEARLGMLVGVAVGWELARELDGVDRPNTFSDHQED